jgi:hypothetical protein
LLEPASAKGAAKATTLNNRAAILFFIISP